MLAAFDAQRDHARSSGGYIEVRMSAIITPERPDSADARALIAELEAQLESLSPRESRHGYSVEQLFAEAVAFFLIRESGIPARCGGVRLVGSEYAE